MNINRREIILTTAGAAFSALFCRRVSAQSPSPLPPQFTALAENAGHLHGKALQQTIESLNGKSIISEEGMVSLINRLVELNLIDSIQAQILKDLIKAILQNDSVEAIQKQISKIYPRVEESGENIFRAIASIARDSVDSAAHLAEKASFKTIVASDIAGALSAAGASEAIATLVPFLPLQAVALLCLLGGAGSASLLAHNGMKTG
jgi:hypothetical protein